MVAAPASRKRSIPSAPEPVPAAKKQRALNVYFPDEEHLLPMSAIYSVEAKCGICPYGNKVNAIPIDNSFIISRYLSEISKWQVGMLMMMCVGSFDRRCFLIIFALINKYHLYSLVKFNLSNLKEFCRIKNVPTGPTKNRLLLAELLRCRLKKINFHFYILKTNVLFDEFDSWVESTSSEDYQRHSTLNNYNCSRIGLMCA